MLLTFRDGGFIKEIIKKPILGFPGICYQCDFRTDLYSDSNVKYLLEGNLESSLSHAATKRKSEFVAGRYLARKGLSALGAKDVKVKIGSNGAPSWPDCFIGSISHSTEFAVCAVAAISDVSKIGIDVEDIITMKVFREIERYVLIGSEHRLVYESLIPDSVALTLIFSAKESLFKALHPEVGGYFGFEAAEMKEIGFKNNSFTLELVKDLAQALPAGVTFKGRFEIDAKMNRVFTMITSPYA